MRLCAVALVLLLRASANGPNSSSESNESNDRPNASNASQDAPAPCFLPVFDAEEAAPVSCPLTVDEAAGLACASLAPSGMAKQNYEAIVHCLSSGPRVAGLLNGTFILPRGIAMPPNSHLFGRAEDGEARPRLVLAAPTGRTGFVLRTAHGSSVGLVDLDADDHLRPAGCCSAVVSVEGDGAFAYDLELLGSPVAAGVYIHPLSARNWLLRVHVHHCLYGVVFAHGLNVSHRNTFERGTIEHVACDAVAFAGYGRLVGSSIRSSGFGCRLHDNSLVQGAGAFCHGSVVGGDIVENTMHHTCGAVLDFDSCANFNVSFNELFAPGSTVDGQGPHCRAPATVVLLDSQDFHVEGNLVANVRGGTGFGAPPEDDTHGVFSDTGAGLFSDLPGGSRPVLGLAVVRRPLRSARPCRGHQVLANRFQAACGGPDSEVPPAPGCVGVGYFAGRGTGADVDARRHPVWHPSRYLGSDAAGSDYGSLRCGRNWYGDGHMCGVRGSSPPCNSDDHEHREANFRNDPGCAAYTNVLADSAPAVAPWAPGTEPTPSEGLLRVPWPEVPAAMQALW